jgi:hypothetical protein
MTKYFAVAAERRDAPTNRFVCDKLSFESNDSPFGAFPGGTVSTA